MPRPLPRLVLLATFALLDACATTDTTSTATTTAQETPPPRRHRRRHRHHATDANATASGASPDGSTATPAAGASATGAANLNASTDGTASAASSPGPINDNPTVVAAPANTGDASGSIGSPVVAAAVREPTPRYVVRNGRGRIVCDGASQRALPLCPQCHDRPDNASIVRAFLPAERTVLSCEPPANREGRLPVRATFSGAGVPLEVEFPGMDVDSTTAQCMGAALCRMHMPTFRSPETPVDYEYVVLVPE